MQGSLSYKIGRWIAKNPGPSLLCVAITAALSYGVFSEQPIEKPIAPKPQVATTPTLDLRDEACGPGLASRRADAKKAFQRKDFEGAIGFLRLCDGRMPKDSDTYKEYMQYVNAQAKVVDAWIAAEAKAAKALKKKQGVSIGMSQQDVLDSSWGRPERVNRTTNAYGVREQWVYGGSGYLYFENGTLTSIQN
jgi:hypothetical protein